MKDFSKNGIGLIKDCAELRKLIAENPDLPIVVVAGSEASNTDYYYTYCSEVHASIKEILDTPVPWSNEVVYEDKSDFEEDLAEHLTDKPEYEKLSDDDFERVLAEEMQKYEKYWTKVIFVSADN